MKLYTEDQLKEAFHCGRLYQGIKGDTNIYHLIDKLTPIELPSNEEIQKESLKSDFEYTFRNGANYVLNKIKGGNNEQE